MYDILPETTDALLAIRISGTLTQPEVEAFHHWLHDRLDRHSYPAAIVVMDGFNGWGDAAAVVEEIKLEFHHHADVSRVAFVGETAWQKVMTVLAAPFATAEVRYFDHADIDEARSWATSAVDQRTRRDDDRARCR